MTPDYRTFKGYCAVDLGLSVRWSSCNIGASLPEDKGEEFRFAETESPSNSSIFYDTSLKRIDITIIGVHYRKGYKRVRYKNRGNTYSIIHYHISRSDKYDVARNKWGAGWRIPTPEEFQELVDNCEWEWKSINNRYGYKITGPNGNNIFLPTNDTFNQRGFYYTDLYEIHTIDIEHDGACFLMFDKKLQWFNLAPNGMACLGIRPVTDNFEVVNCCE